ncbi:hypothetical protein H257_03048 [Aphanomyces astaci]|uniref:Uncharacterized protein n=1 Tax=Aphanomyces astaci TaxID=112090 RepID=W4H0X7_APHAT|nr:hypothetical protein H257_03048 [Aphanomyces astaci]ETV85236.1 hypothetical protein H257_03048 [Aphanomyces astaci]|eukprot:XP_009825254.1 hypothetical protein H257_03048 [Aphanomyces astaci]
MAAAVKPSSSLEWKRIIHAMRDPGRSEYSFVPHKYIHSTPILSPTPDNMQWNMLDRRDSVHYSAVMYWFILIVLLSFMCVEWVLLYPLSPSRLYNIQVDMCDGRVNLAEFLFQQILPLGMLLGSLITFKLALGRATMLELAAIKSATTTSGAAHSPRRSSSACSAATWCTLA